MAKDLVKKDVKKDAPKAIVKPVVVAESPIVMIPLTNGERSRTYIWESGAGNTIENVTHICIRPSGYHRLQTADGQKHIIPPGWIQMIVDADEWSC